MQQFSRNLHPDLLTSLTNMSLALRLPRKRHLCRSSSNVPRLPTFLKLLQNLCTLLTFDKVHNPLRLPRKTISELPKVLQDQEFLTLLTAKCASCGNGVHFFNSSTSKSAPSMVCFVHFDLETCFAPQRRAIFHLSEPTFRPSRATKHWKNTMFRGFAAFLRACIFFLLPLSLL